jgi:hypothetical protein
MVETWQKMWARYALSAEPASVTLKNLVIDAYLAMDAKVTKSIPSLTNPIDYYQVRRPCS